MILIDANLLIYAYDASSPHHEKSRGWLEDLFSRGRPVGLPWVVILAFVRIITNPRAFERPLALNEAIAHVDSWLERSEVRPLMAGPRHWQIFSRLLEDGQASGPLATDAHLAALAIEVGATLATNDRDFTRFEGVKLDYPLVDDGWIHEV